MTGAGEHVRPLGRSGQPRARDPPVAARALDARGLPRVRRPRRRSAAPPSWPSSRRAAASCRSTTTSRTPPARCARRSTRRSPPSPRRAPTTCSCPARARRCSGSTTTPSGRGPPPRAVGGIAAEPGRRGASGRCARREVGLAARRRRARRLPARAAPQARQARARRRRARRRPARCSSAPASIDLPNIEKLIEDVGTRLGRWTYLLVGAARVPRDRRVHRARSRRGRPRCSSAASSRARARSTCWC